MGKEEACDIQWWGLTDKGPFRKNNEDAFLALTFDADEVHLLGKEGEADFALGDFVFAVSDGMGGANAGEFASRIAVQAITQRFPKQFRTDSLQAEGAHEKVLVALFEQIHAEMVVMGRHYEECSGMGATLSMVWLTPWKGYFCHVGDSRIYRIPPDGRMEQVTEDHTHVGWLFRQGKLNEREARYHEGRHMLQMCLGGKTSTLQPQAGSFALQPGERLVLCTDGLIEGLWDSSIRRILLDPPPRLNGLSPSRRLMEEALSESGRDNTTVVVVRARDEGRRTKD
ncbi:MAG: PP2C family protein-serine/threonine phosphatase [Oceanipulchritudo sp.]